MVVPNTHVKHRPNWRTWGHELGLGGLLGNSKWRDLFIKICSSAFPKFNYKSLVNSYYSSFRSDWTAYDIQLAKKVPETAKNIYETDEFPVKVTATSLGYHLNSLPEIIKQRHELPRTMGHKRPIRQISFHRCLRIQAKHTGFTQTKHNFSQECRAVLRSVIQPPNHRPDHHFSN